MTQSNEAVARYHKLIETDPYRNLDWARQLQQEMADRRLVVSGRPVSPVVRPHFLTRRQYSALVKGAEAVLSAIDRVCHLALATPSLLSRLQLLPAEKMLASIDPGYPYFAVTARLDTVVDEGSMRVERCDVEDATGAIFGGGLSEAFFDNPLTQEIRKRATVTPANDSYRLLDAMLSAYQTFGGQRKPRIAVLDFRQPFQNALDGPDGRVINEFRSAGYAAEVVSPEQLEYRNGVLRRGEFEIDLIYRRVRTHEFVIRCDLNHPLVRAYRDGSVCMVNSFRAELGQKLAILDLLTDDAVTAQFPAHEKKAIQDHVPWTRVVAARKTNVQGQVVDLVEWIRSNRERLVLQPNDNEEDMVVHTGSELDEKGWERAIRIALRNPYVVQETAPASTALFPVYRYGQLEMQRMQVNVTPHALLGQVHSCSVWLSVEGSTGFSTLNGVAPVMVIDAKTPDSNATPTLS